MCFADKCVKMRRNKKVISENLKLRQVAGVVSVLSFFSPQLRIRLSKTQESRMKAFFRKWTGWSSSGKENQAMPPCTSF